MLEFSESAEQSFRLGFAGDTFNVAWHMRAALSKEWQIDFVTALGDDPYSSQMLDFFKLHGIGTSQIRRIPGARPGLYIIRQQADDRAFTYWRGQSAARQLAAEPAFLASALSGAHLIYFSGITLAILNDNDRKTLLQSIAVARSGGAMVAFDPNERPILWGEAERMRHWLHLAASHADVVLPTFADEKLHFSDPDIVACARRFADWGVKEVVIKNGTDPAYAATPEFVGEVEAVAGVEVVDPTGAGDCFNGIYLSSRLQAQPVKHSLALAHRIASQLVQRPGALLPQEQVHNLLKA